MKIHLVGVGGVAMGNLAAMLKQEGHELSGSDHDLYPPMSDRLEEWGIDVRNFSEDNIGHSDLYIIGNAISRGNPEVEKILNENLDYMSMPQALSRFFLRGKEVIVVAGTHGKTTTTFLMDHILAEAGVNAGLFAGGVRTDGMPGFRVGNDNVFVIEGDEYDSAFFDKHSKFVHYRPRFLILTSIEYDHADIFPDFETYKLSFRRLLRLIPSEGLVAACHDDEGVRDVMEDYAFSPVRLYGAKSDMSSGLLGFRRHGRTVDMDFPGVVENFALIGDHNTKNALAAAIIAERMGIAREDIIRALQTFPGVLRRQQIRINLEKTRAGGKVTLIEDFAHHPTAVRETMRAVREAYPGRKLHVLFEPRSATSHRNIFQEEYIDQFSGADGIYLCDVFNKTKVSENLRLNVSEMVEKIRDRLKSSRGDVSIPVVFGNDPNDLLEKFKTEFRPSDDGDVILIMSNGAFGGIYPLMDKFIESFSS